MKNSYALPTKSAGREARLRNLHDAVLDDPGLLGTKKRAGSRSSAFLTEPDLTVPGHGANAAASISDAVRGKTRLQAPEAPDHLRPLGRIKQPESHPITGDLSLHLSSRED